MPEEEKAKFVRFEDGKVVVEFEKSFDPNADGEPLGSVKFEIALDLSEVVDEAYDFYKKKKGK